MIARHRLLSNRERVPGVAVMHVEHLHKACYNAACQARGMADILPAPCTAKLWLS